MASFENEAVLVPILLACIPSVVMWSPFQRHPFRQDIVESIHPTARPSQSNGPLPCRREPRESEPHTTSLYCPVHRQSPQGQVDAKALAQCEAKHSPLPAFLALVEFR